MNTPMVPSKMVIPLGIQEWIVSESYYPNLRVGQEFDCALRFGGVATLAATDKHEVCMSQAGNDIGLYDVVARVLHFDEEIYVIDCGLRAYTRDTGYDAVERHEFVAGRVGFSVDPYDYREFWSKRLGIPLIYRWHIERILEPRPYRSFKACADATAFHDDSNWYTVDVDRTKSAEMDSETKGYCPTWELHCRLVSPEPRLSRPDESLI